MSDVSDVKVMSSTVAVKFAITWVVSNYIIQTEPHFFNQTEANSFQAESEFFFKNQTEMNQNQKIYSAHP